MIKCQHCNAILGPFTKHLAGCPTLGEASRPDEPSGNIICGTPRETEALWLANRDKESILKRLDADIAAHRALPSAANTINGYMATAAIGALE